MTSDFSKYEIYTSCDSVYCYKGTNILINKLNIRDSAALKTAETELTFLKQEFLTDYGITGRFSVTHLKSIHKTLFEDIYSFAGKYRTEQIGKSNTWFYPSNAIEPTVKKLLDRLKSDRFLQNMDNDQFADRTAYYMAELNAIHPFREGNGRTIREFIRQLCLYNDRILDWSKCTKDEVLEASILSYDDHTALIPIISKCILFQ